MPTYNAAATSDGQHHLRGRHRRRIGATFVAGALLVAAGCGQDDDEGGLGGGREVDVAMAPADYEATPQFLRSVVDDSTGEAHRIEMSMTMDISAQGQSIDVDVPMFTGEQVGEDYAMQMDVGEMFDSIAEQTGQSVPSELSGEDTIMEIAGNSQELYIRAPFMADAGIALDSMGGGNSAVLDVYEQLGDQWGYVDLAIIGEDLGTQATAGLGGNSFDPRAIVDTIEQAGEVEELGTEEMDGTPVTGLAADVSLGDLLEAQGMDAEDFVGQLSAGMGQPEELVEAVYEVPLPIEVWMDQEGLVRQMGFTFTMDTMTAIVEAAGEDASEFEDQVDNFEMGFTIDLFDYGDPSISVELPVRSQAIDITEDYAAALGV